MQIVIDIDKETLNNISFFGLSSSKDRNNLLSAIKNGTPLPEHHGRLIDADELHHKIGEWLKPQKADESVMVALDDIAISTIMEIEEAPTIIEGSED